MGTPNTSNIQPVRDAARLAGEPSADGKYRISWPVYNDLIERLALQVLASGIEFDTIVCLARGGLRVGDALSRILKKPLGVMFTSSYRENAGQTQSTLYISEVVCSARPLPGQRVLLVDDLADSGVTLVEVMNRLNSYFPQLAEVKTAVLWLKGVSKCTPDFYVEYLEQSPWIVQPFEIYDECDLDALRAKHGA